MTVHVFGGPPGHPDDVCTRGAPGPERYGTTFMCHLRWSLVQGRYQYVCLDCGHVGALLRTEPDEPRAGG